MDKERLIINENELSYEEINKIKEHAKKYDEVSDKKEFLRSAGAYEQKIILLESKKPYDVLNYLTELGFQTSKLILNSLKYEEIEKILQLFSSEDKKNFYETFSDLSLVNQFITIDNNSKEYIKDLNFDRKVELIDSSNTRTIEASEIVYESMPYNERELASSLVTNANASAALNQVDTYNNDVKISEIAETNNIDAENIKLETPEQIEQKVEEEVEKQQQDQKDKMVEQINNDKTNFLKTYLQNYTKTNPEFASLLNNPEITYEMLPEGLKNVIDKDFEVAKEQEKNKLPEEKTNEIEEQQHENNKVELKEDNQIGLEEFQNAKAECEKEEIQQIKSNLEVEPLEIETQKTL